MELQYNLYLLPKLQSKRTLLRATVMNIGLEMARHQQFRSTLSKPAFSYCWFFFQYQVTIIILTGELVTVEKKLSKLKRLQTMI